MIRTDGSPISTPLSRSRPVSAVRLIGWRTWLIAGLASMALIAPWWTTPIRWLAPIAATTAITAAVVDWRTLRVPNPLSLAGFIATAVVGAPLVLAGALRGQDMLVGLALMAGPLLVSHLATRGRTPGLGDVKLAGVLGLTLGAVSLRAAYWSLLASLLIGAAFGIWYQRRTGRRGFPFAPAIAAATIGVLAVLGAVERGLV